MSRNKKTISDTLIKANARISGIKSINATLDFGDGKSVATYQGSITTCQSKLDAYNTLLSQVDAAYNDFIASEKTLKDWNEAMLIAVANKYGKNSNEYEKAGGTRKSEHKKPAKKAPKA
ncbi:MAG: hypothetical protein IT239_04175 [Bacteroidia bacterium]|nr:hypothetical protein [Bacteroidia bacterium]